MTRVRFLLATSLIIHISSKTAVNSSKINIDQGSTTPCASAANTTTSIKPMAIALSIKSLISLLRQNKIIKPHRPLRRINVTELGCLFDSDDENTGIGGRDEIDRQ